MMKRIGSKILIAIVSLTMATSLIIGGFIYIKSTEYIKTESIRKLEYMSLAYSDKSSRRLRTVESILETMRLSVINSFDIDQFYADESYLLEFEESIDEFFRQTAVNNDDFEGVYLTFNAELSGDFREIWYLTIEPGMLPQRVDNELYDLYADTPATGDDIYPNISLFSRDNPAMEYYYLSLETEGGFWSEPAVEVGLPMTIISYTSSVYKENLLIGVIGIDINIENIRNSIRDLEIMQHGRAFLMNDDLEIIVHPSYPEYTKLEDTEPDTWELLRNYTLLEQSETETGIFSTDSRIYSCSRLSNGWILVLSLAHDDIFEPLDALAYAIAIIALLISGFSFIAAWALSRKISTPIELAAKQLRNIRDRNFSTEFPLPLLQRDDEIGTFIKSVNSMSEIIREEIEKNRQKDAVLTYQSRLAKTGEMIAHIAHQWRQPLNNLNLIISNVNESRRIEKPTDEETIRSLQKCSRIISGMSQTIDDFRYFLNPKSDMNYFSIKSSVNFVIELMEDSLKQNQIRIETDFTDSPRAYGAAHELTQVISNILYNARDVLIANQEDNRFISISITGNDEKGVIEIFNNGPRIEADVIPQLFKPYFTTKSDDKGTGIGLYMSKQIIEKHFNGTISLENRTDGVMCRMEIKNERTL